MSGQWRGADRVAVLAHGGFPGHAKTAVGVLRYGDFDVVGVLDRTKAGEQVDDYLADLPAIPLVSSFEDVPGAVEALLIGAAPFGGGFDESWRPDVRAALEAGCDVVSGLHYMLGDDDEFARLAAQHGGELFDVRAPPAELSISRGRSGSVDAQVIHVVGTDSGIGKLTTTVELVQAARGRGLDAGFVATGQTGIMIDNWGVAIDRVQTDFVTGAVEQLVLDKAEEHELLFVEGQGSLVHPAYSAASCGVLHGAMADQLVLVHEAGRDYLEGFEDFPIPDLGQIVDLYESVAAPVHDATVDAGSLDTSSADGDAAARDLVENYSMAIDAPATDVIRFDANEILDPLL